MKYSDLYDGPIIDLTPLAEEPDTKSEEPDNELEKECEQLAAR